MAPDTRYTRIWEMLQFIRTKKTATGKLAALHVVCRGEYYGSELMEHFSFQLDEEDMEYLQKKYTPVYEEYLLEDKKKRLAYAELTVAKLRKELNLD